MLDLEIIVDVTDEPTDVVSVVEMRRQLNIPTTVTLYDDDLQDAITAALAALEGPSKELNRSIRPVTYTRYLKRFPDLVNSHGRVLKQLGGPILLPYPELIEVVSISVDVDSPSEIVAPADYVVKKAPQVPELWPKTTWPDVSEGERAIAVTYRAGYADYASTKGTMPLIKQYLKMLAGHYFNTREIAMNENRMLAINRKVEYGGDYLRSELKVANSYDDWGDYPPPRRTEGPAGLR